MSAGLMLPDIAIGFIMENLLELKIVPQQKTEHTLLMEKQSELLWRKIVLLSIIFLRKMNGTKQHTTVQ